ncbi:membrane protein [Sulfurospirillum arcachonense]|uniref:membrane protein n=1 Tax=Sulfurospirillum arcachonense TaxID=57666 RepID=UPI0004687B3F|nr:membrane protein [Sulfurospirillum arcachonense]
MLNKDKVVKEEDILREKVQNLPDNLKKQFYEKIEKEIKDPDTYAVLNWLFLTGIHHLYLKKWLKGAINLILFIVGIVLLFDENIYFGVGIGILVAIFIIELNELFQSQIIVHNYNNEVTQKILEELN